MSSSHFSNLHVETSLPLTGLSLHSSPTDLPMKHKNLVFPYLSEKQIIYCKILYKKFYKTFAITSFKHLNIYDLLKKNVLKDY